MKNMRQFLSFRRKTLAALILHTLKCADEQLESLEPGCLCDVTSCEKRIVHVDPSIDEKWQRFHKEMIEGKLYIHPDVMRCNYKARKIVGDLFDCYVEEQRLMPADYRTHMQEAYSEFLSSEETELMGARNYIAGMTDSFATEHHKRLFMSSERASFI